MTEFTPILSLTGGVLIGISAIILMMFLGRIAGISGILSGLLPPWRNVEETIINWRLTFVIGLVLSPMIVQLVTGQAIDHVVSDNTLLMIVAGLLVGLGTGLGSGCTSGHGVCGISRLSVRSIVATIVFMGAGIVTVYVLRHVVGA